MRHTFPRVLLALPLLASTAQAQCEEQRLFNPNPEALDGYGWCVDIVDDLAVIGCVGDDDACPTDPNCNSGSAFVFELQGGAWVQTAKLLPSDLADRFQFGQDVSIWGDRIAVTAHQNGPGAVYVFERQGTSWAETQRLAGSMLGPAFHFGHSVSFVESTLLIGTMRDTIAGNDSGSAYIFEDVGGTWVETAYLTASVPTGGARFGRAVASTRDWAFVGAPFMDQVGPESGAVYVYERDENGTPSDPLDDAWPQLDLLLGSDTDAGDFFGRAIAVEGDTLVISASKAESGGVETGAAYVFERQNGVWVEIQKLTATDNDEDDEFGMSLELDGDRMLIGARFDDESGMNAGAVYLFERGPGGWVETRKFLASDPSVGASMGDEMAVSLWGTTAFIGSRFSQTMGNLAGEAYVVDLAGCIGDPYCTVTLNSTGASAPVEGRGSLLVARNDFSVHASSLPPNQFGYFLVSPTQGFFGLAGGSAGNLCLDGQIGRYIGSVFQSGAAGTGAQVIDLAMIPTPMASTVTQPGDTLSFQAWHRDVVGGVTTSNFTEAIEVTFR